MGWLWPSPTPDPSTSNVPTNVSANQNNRASNQSPNPPKAEDESSSTSASREEITDKELQSFLKDLQSASVTSKPSPNPKYTRKFAPSSSTHPIDSKFPLSEQLLPTTMSCRNAFDAAFYCNSLGGKFNDIYRYGSLRPCSEHWNKFWFCMRTRTWGENEKEEAIRDYYRKVERRKYGPGHGSSEDIWKSRDEKIGENLWTEKMTVFEGSDEEWNKMDREARASIRRQAEDELLGRKRDS